MTPAEQRAWEQHEIIENHHTYRWVLLFPFAADENVPVCQLTGRVAELFQAHERRRRRERWLVQDQGCWRPSTGWGTLLRTWPGWWSGSGWTNTGAGGPTPQLFATISRTYWRGTPGEVWCWGRWMASSPLTSSTCSPCTSSDRTQVRDARFSCLHMRVSQVGVSTKAQIMWE